MKKANILIRGVSTGRWSDSWSISNTTTNTTSPSRNSS